MTSEEQKVSQLPLATAILAGAALAAIAIPRWAPVLAATLAGPEPKAFWYLSRVTGLIGYALLFVSVSAGLLASTGIGRSLSKGPLLFDLHRHGAWLGLAFAGFHALVLLFDPHVGGSFIAVLVPFGMTMHEPGWVALGQIALYGGLAVALSFRFRGKIGARTWRAIHFGSFSVYVLALAHGLFAGTDASSPLIFALFAASGGVVLMLTLIRLATARS